MLVGGQLEAGVLRDMKYEYVCMCVYVLLSSNLYATVKWKQPGRNDDARADRVGLLSRGRM